MFHTSERNSPDDHKARQRRRSRNRSSTPGPMSGSGASRKSIQRNFRHLAYETLETRQLLSGASDLTTDITQLLNNNQTSTPTNLGNVSLGNDLSFNDVTVSFGSSIVQTGSNWTAAVTVSATSASLTVGSGATAQITGAGGNPGLSGTYTLTDQPASQGAYQLTASQFDLTLSNLLTANSSNVTVDYSPAAAAGQELVQIGSLSATILPLDNATATVDNLDIFDDHFTLGDGTVTASPITLGNILSINQPSLKLTSVGYNAGVFTGTIGLTASSASLFPGQNSFSASADTLTGTYTVATQKMTLSADSVELEIGKILDANASGLNFTLDDSSGSAAVTLGVQNLNVTSPDFPSLTGTIGDLSANNGGFTVSTASLSSSGDIEFGKILDISSPTLALNNFGYTVGATPAVTGAFTVGGTINVFPGQTSFSTTANDFSASYDIASEAFGINATSIDLNLGKVLTATTGAVAFTFNDSGSSPAVSFDVKNVNVTSPDFPSLTGTIGDLSANNGGFTVSTASLSSSGDIKFGKILDISSPTLALNNFGYTIGATPAVTGAFTVGGTIKLFPGQTSFSTTVNGFNASYDIASEAFGINATSIDLNLGKVLTATTGAVAFTFNDSGSSPAVSFDVQNVNVTSPDFPGLTGTIGDLSANNGGFTVSTASLSSSGDIKFGKILDISSPTLSLNNFGYTVGATPAVTGAFTVGGTINLFPGQTSFSTTANGFSASYDIASEAFGINATSIDLKLGKVLTATTGAVAFTFNDSGSSPAVSFDVQNVNVTSSDFPGLTGTIGDLSANNGGFTVSTASLSSSGDIKFGKILDISSPTLSLNNFGYTVGATPAVTGAFTVGGTINVFPGQTSFSTTANGFSASYDIASEAFGINATSIDLKLGKVLTATTGAVAFTFNDSGSSPAVSFDVQNVNVTSPDFPSLTGTIGDLSANNGGFTVSTASLSSSGDIEFGKILDISSPTLALNNFGYTVGATPAVTGAFTVGGTINLFPGQTSFSTTANDFSASYDIASEAFGINATSIDLKLGKVLTATTGAVGFTFNDSGSSPAVSFDVKDVNVTSPDFPSLTGTIGDLSANNGGFTVSTASLSSSGDIEFGKILDISSPTLALNNFGYTVGATPAVTGAFTVGGTINLFPGQTSFSTTANGFSASYDIASEAFGINATSIDLNLGKVLTATTGAVAFTFNDSGSSPAVSFDVQNVNVTSPDFPSLTGTIGDLSANNGGFTVSTASLSSSGDIKFGKILDISSPTLALNNFGYTVGATPAVTGAFTVGGTINVFPGQTSFSTTASGFSASYDIASEVFGINATSIDLNLGKVLTATTGAVAFTFNDSGSSPAVSFDVQNVNVTSPDFPSLTGTIGDLSANNGGFTVSTASLSSSGDIEFGKILDISSPTLGLSDFSYTPGGSPVVAGTFTVGGTIKLFPGQTSFSTTVNGFNASYDIASDAFGINATSIALKLSNVVTATTGAVAFTFVDTSGSPSVSFDVKDVKLASPDFPSLTGAIGDLSADDTGFKVSSASLTYSGDTKLGSVLSIRGLTLGIETFQYMTSDDSVSGTVTFGAASVSMFSGQAFSTTISDPSGQSPSGLSGSYDINSQAFNLELDEVDFKVSDILEVIADNVVLNVAPGSFSMTVGSATASVPKLAGFQGSITNLMITNDGFSIDSATLGLTGGKSLNLGSVISITDPSATITKLAYSIDTGAQFNGDINVKVGSASLKLGNLANASVSGLSITLGLMSTDLGQFQVSATSAEFTLSSYLTVTAANPMFNTAATGAEDIASFTNVTAVLNAGPLSVTAGVNDFAIDANGNFVTLPGFDLSFSVGDAVSQLSWPSFLPLKSASVALAWPNFSKDPTNFTIDLSASIDFSLAGIELAGSVTDAIIDVGKLEAGQFPVTSIGAASFAANGTFAGAKITADGFLATYTDPKGNSVLYGGIDGGLDFAGLAGFEIRLGISQLGPLDVYAKVDAPIILEPDTGLAITDLSAGINFGSGLTTPSSAANLGTAAAGVFAPTLTQWESQLAADVQDQVASNASWSNPPTLLTIQGGATLFDAYASPDAFEVTGNIAFDTTGKLLISGTAALGGSIKVNASAFIDLSQVASGKAKLLIDVTAPADGPIINTYGEVDFEFDGPVLNPVLVPAGSSAPQLGTGLVLDGSTGYGSAANINLNNTSFTLEFWAQRNATSQLEDVVGQAPATPASTTGLSIGFDTNNNFVVTSGGTSLSFPAGEDTSWHDWAVTFDATTGTRSIYRDGILEASDTAAPIKGASTTLLIGKSGSIYFGGGVDEVRVWNVARTAAQIQANLALTTITASAGLLADWSFSEDKGTTAADSSGNGNTLALTGGVTWGPTTIAGATQQPQGPTTPQLGTGLALDGTDAGAYASASGIDLNDKSFTVEFWAKQNDTGRLEYVINQGDPASAGGLQIGFNASNNFFVSFGGSTLTTPTNDNNWHEWAVTFNSTTGQRIIYRDGMAMTSDTAKPIAIAGSIPTFLIGKSDSFYFDGNVDEVRVWTVVRTQTDIQNNMNSSSTDSTIGLLADWNFNEGSGTTAGDSSGNQHAATISGGATWIQTVVTTSPAAPFLGFTITISGGIDLSLKNYHVPADILITGDASFRVDVNNASLQLNINGMMDINPLGNALDLEGVLHFDLGSHPYTSPQPEYYGIFVLQTGQLFNALSSYGLNVNGLAVFRFNTTASPIMQDLPIPDADPTKPEKIQHFSIDPQTVSLMVQGDINFQLNGQQWFGLDGTFDAIFEVTNNQPVLDVLFNAYLVIGPTTAPLIELTTEGFLQISSGGVAGELLVSATLAPNVTQALAAAGLNLAPTDPATNKPVKNSFNLELNTYSTEVKYTPPSLTSSDPGLPQFPANLSIDIPAAPPNPDGSIGSTAQPYLAITGSGGFELVNSLLVTGSFYVVVTGSSSTFEFSDQVNLVIPGDSNPILGFMAFGGIVISNQGIYGALQLTLNSSLPPGFGFSLNLSAGALLEVNTLNQPETIANATQSISIPVGPYLDVDVQGKLTVGPVALSATFDFTLSTAGVTLNANGSATLGPLGSLALGGAFKFLVNPNGSPAGIVGLIQTATDASLSGTGFSFDSNFEFEINTTTAAQQVTGFVVQKDNSGHDTGTILQNQTITIQPGVVVQAGGSLTFVDLIDVTGEFDIMLTTNSLMVSANASISGILGLNDYVTAMFAVGENSLGNPYVTANVGLHFSASLGSQLFSISASPQLIVNTNTNDYELDLNNASLSALGLTLSGTLDAKFTNGVFEIDVPQSNPLSLSFFNIGHANVYGFLSSNGQFSLTGSVGFDLDDGNGDSIYGSFSITVSNQGLQATASGGATVLGVNLASVSGTVDIEGSGVYLGATVYVIGIPFNFHLQIGTIGASHPANAIYWYSVPARALEGGQTVLNAAASDSSGNTVGNYSWTVTGPYGFNQTLSGAEPTLTLGAPGIYQVTLKAGAGLTESSTITVADVAPVISSVGNLVAYAIGLPQTITPAITAPTPSTQDGGGLKYSWTLTRNGVPYVPSTNLSASALTFTPPPLADQGNHTPDIYTVTLTVKDNWGGVATASSTFSTADPANDMVSNTNDTGPGSLRAAIDTQYTSESSGFFAITFAPSLAYQTITLTTIDDTTDHGNSAIRIAPGEFIDINATNVPGITITSAQSTPGYGPTRRLFYIGTSAILRLQGLTLTGGIAYGTEDQATGGAVYVDTYATLGLENCTIINNQATGTLGNVGQGPGYATNVIGADGRGGAVFVNTGGNLIAADDTFAGNAATGATGIGYLPYYYGPVTYYSGAAYGGAIDNNGGMILSNDTIAGNSATAGGGPYADYPAAGAGIAENNNPVSFINNTIVAGNSGAADYNALSSVSASGGNDIIANPGANTPSAYLGLVVNPLLGPLANQGAGRLTYSLLPGSPALGAGNPSATYSEQIDGRGAPRLDSSGKVDIGAFEHQPYIVSNTNDSGLGSLRAAIAEDDDSSPIYFASGLSGQTILLTSGPIVIATNLTLTGPGANQLTIESAAGTATPVSPADFYQAESNISDSAGSANGTAYPSVAYATGRVGQAFQLNGSDYIGIPSTADVTGTGAFAIGVWIKTSSDGVIIQQRDGSNFNGEYQLAVSGGKLYWWDYGNSQYGFSMTSVATVADNNWHYVVAVRQTNGTGQLYIDGQLDSSQAGASVPIAANVNVYIGADERNLVYGSPGQYFNGLIDQVAIYHSALTAANVSSMYSEFNGGRVFTVNPGVTVTLTGLTIAGGVAATGGGIYNSGNLTIVDSTLSGNAALSAPNGATGSAGEGGAIYNATGGVLTVTGSAVPQ